MSHVGKDHVNCLGGGWKPSAVMKPLVSQIIAGDSMLSAAIFQKALKNVNLNVSRYTALRMIK